MDSTRGRPTLPPEAGFALIEVLISGVIAVVAATGIVALMQSSVHTASDQRNKSESYALAQEDQARLRGMAISSLKSFEQTRTVHGRRHDLHDRIGAANSPTARPVAN